MGKQSQTVNFFMLRSARVRPLQQMSVQSVWKIFRCHNYRFFLESSIIQRNNIEKINCADYTIYTEISTHNQLFFFTDYHCILHTEFLFFCAEEKIQTSETQGYWSDTNEITGKICIQALDTKRKCVSQNILLVSTTHKRKSWIALVTPRCFSG